MFGDVRQTPDNAPTSIGRWSGTNVMCPLPGSGQAGMWLPLCQVTSLTQCPGALLSLLRWGRVGSSCSDHASLYHAGETIWACDRCQSGATASFTFAFSCSRSSPSVKMECSKARAS